jgi:hypothetical protein
VLFSKSYNIEIVYLDLLTSDTMCHICCIAAERACYIQVQVPVIITAALALSIREWSCMKVSTLMSFPSLQSAAVGAGAGRDQSHTVALTG